MLGKIFLQILNMSFTASYVILFVLLARILLKKMPKNFSYSLWLVVLFRLVCPISFESIFSIFSLTGQDTNDIRPFPADFTTILPPETVIQYPNSTVMITPLERPPFEMIFTALWLVGIAALIIYSVASLLMLKRKLRGAAYEGDNIYLAEWLASPFVMGLFRPKIYLPANLTESEKRYILLHEQTHIKRLDHVVKIVGFAVLCLHWFNPLVWVAFFLCGKDMEMSCDEAVIKRLGSEIKKDYSSSLLTLATGRRIVGGSPLAFGEGDTKCRIKNVLSYKNPAFWVVGVSAIVVIAIGIGLAVNPKEPHPSMQWAKNLTVNDVQTIEFIRMPSHANDRYAKWEQDSYPDIVKLINQSHGTYIAEPEFISGGGQTFYITTADGKRHTFSNNGNIYLQIDGETYKAPSYWLREWNFSGNAAVPENFDSEASPLSVEGDATSGTDFTAATMTEHINGVDQAQVKITDPTAINKLRSLLLIGDLTDKQSIQDVPNKDSYIHITFQSSDGPVDYFVYEEAEYGKAGTYYLEQPYNGIRKIRIDTLEQIMSIMTETKREVAEAETPADVEAFLIQISQSFQIKEGVARFNMPLKMPSGYAASQLSVHVSGSMPMGDDGSNMSLHAYEKEDELRSWQLGEEYIERMLDVDVPDGTEVYASFYLTEKDGVSKYYTTVPKIFPMREDFFTPSVSISVNGLVQTITFSDRYNDKLTLTCTLPDGWSLKAPVKDDALITGESVNIYAGGLQIGSLFYNRFKLHRDENGNIPYMSVYSGIMLGSMASWDNEYTEIYTDATTCVATCKPWHNVSFPGVSNAGAPTVYSKGILAYNTDARGYIALELNDSSVTDTQWQTIAKSVRLSTPQA